MSVSVTPLRIQRSRAKGARLPPGAIYVGRTNSESDAWANPFRIGGYFKRGNPGRILLWTQRLIWNDTDRLDAILTGHTLINDAAMAVEWFEWLTSIWPPMRLARCRDELGNHDLACWCRLCPEHKAGKPFGVKCEACAPCHADVLGIISNA